MTIPILYMVGFLRFGANASSGAIKQKEKGGSQDTNLMYSVRDSKGIGSLSQKGLARGSMSMLLIEVVSITDYALWSADACWDTKLTLRSERKAYSHQQHTRPDTGAFRVRFPEPPFSTARTLHPTNHLLQ